MRIPQLKEKLLLVSGYGALVVLLSALRVPCFSILLFGIPCPGCGMTRAWLAVLRLDFSTAFSMHLMFWAMPLLFVYFLRGRGLFRRVWIDRAILIGIGIGFFVNWMLAIFY